MTTINRRQFLKMSSLTAAFLALSACKPIAQFDLEATPTAPAATTPAPISTSTPEVTRAVLTPTPQKMGPTSSPELARLLRRITFGVRQDELAHAQQVGFNQFIDEQLDYLSIPDADLEGQLSSFQSLTLSPQQMRSQYPKKSVPASELVQATLIRAVSSKRQLHELMVDFWSNHFNIYIAKENIPYLKPQDDHTVIRKFALGKFSALLSASVHSPAMLAYLDNHISTRNRPNENYARELLELHTLGVDGGYTQNDVKDVARALTGWSYTNGSQNFGQFNFMANQHDRDPKTILNIAFPAGKGSEDGDKVIDLLAHHPATAQFIATKLVRRFVADNPPPALVKQAASTFTRTDGDLKQVMSTILHSAEFRASLGTKLKRPLEWVISALRAVNAHATFDKGSASFLDSMGQPIFRWASPDGFPDVAEPWMTTNDLLARWNFAMALAFNTLKDSPVDFSAFADALKDPATGVNRISQQLLGEPLSEEAATVLVNFARSADAKTALPGTIALLLASPSFQYR